MAKYRKNARTFAVDFDGTLAVYDGYKGVGVYGPPVPRMMARVQKWLADGHEVVIFTSRLSRKFPRKKQNGEREAIEKWLLDNGLPLLEITANKHPRFTEIWDDRAIWVSRNSGKTLGEI